MVYSTYKIGTFHRTFKYSFSIVKPQGFWENDDCKAGVAISKITYMHPGETTVKKENHESASSANPWMFVSLFLGALLVASFVTNIYVISTVSDLRTGTAPTAPRPSAPQPLAPSQPVAVDASGPSIGDPNAPVTIIEFSDFECPFCKRFKDQTFPSIEQNYIDTGKVRIVFRHYPLPFHQNAQKAHEASICAHDQGKFWEYHDALFANQADLSVPALKQYATNLGLNTATFNNCLDSGKYAQAVQDDLVAGSAAGVSGTPSFFVNGQLVVGAQPYSAFQQAIEAALAE
jgi:protein-disulfide isomerase